MTENEFILADRIQKIKSTIEKYGEENFYISFSGGKDSTVLHYLVDEAIPGNQIPRVYANTGIELNMIRDFVFDMQKTDSRIQVIKPSVPIKQTLEKEGYPFKSKGHSEILDRYQRSGRTLSVVQYLGEREDKKPWSPQKSCPKVLQYQFTDGFDIRVSDRCCLRLKEEPIKRWAKEANRPYGIVGIMRDEGGRRSNAVCMAFVLGKLDRFQPLVPITKDWEEWFIKTGTVKICDIYGEPYNFRRTGCKGCPFARELQSELEILEKYFPAERKQCELIWAPVYAEYRRLGYRLKQTEEEQIPGQMDIFDYLGDSFSYVPYSFTLADFTIL